MSKYAAMLGCLLLPANAFAYGRGLGSGRLDLNDPRTIFGAFLGFAIYKQIKD